jgi:hypothetical protein
VSGAGDRRAPGPRRSARRLAPALAALLTGTHLAAGLSGGANSDTVHSGGALAMAAAPQPVQAGGGDAASGTPRIPPNAIRSVELETSPAWRWAHDQDTRGGSVGQSNYPVYPDGRGGLAGRQFVSWYSGEAGERYHLVFGRDPNATHFVYEANVYLVDPPQVAAVEMDMNQVLPDGRTVIFGTQCAVKSRSWEYTYVDGSGTHWHPSNIACNPQTWGAKRWHHVKIASHRDADGNVTYDWVSFDGALAEFQGATVFSAQALGWSPGELLLNFQVNGSQPKGTADAYVNSLTIYRW